MRTRAIALVLFCCCSLAAAAAVDEDLAEAVVEGAAPRYVAPTTRDSIGRVWVPVHVDGKGPYRFVLDTGAGRSAVTSRLATMLQASLDRTPAVLLHGITGAAVTPTMEVAQLQVGNLWVGSGLLPVVDDVFGGAEGLLGTGDMQQHRIAIDFCRDYIDIARSRNQGAAAGFGIVRFLPNPANLLVVQARVGKVPVRAIIDTGAQSSMGNDALRAVLRSQLARRGTSSDEVTGATGEMQGGVGIRVEPIRIGDVTMREAHVTFGAFHIFEQWDLRNEPVLVIGMDLLGLTEQLVIDYRRRELHVKPRPGVLCQT